MYKNYHFYHYFPKIRRKKHFKAKKSTKKHIKKQLVKKKHKKAHVLFKSTLYEHCTQQCNCKSVTNVVHSRGGNSLKSWRGKVVTEHLPGW